MDERTATLRIYQVMSKSGKTTIQTYFWPEGSETIAQINTRSDKDSCVAYLYPAPGAGNLYTLREQFKKQGWTVLSETLEGEPAIRVSRLKKPNDLIDFLQQNGIVQGQPQIRNSDVHEKTGSRDWSAAAYMAGNMAMFVSGLQRHNDLAQMATGTAFTVGDMVLLAFGKKDDHRTVNSLLGQLAKNLQENNIAIPQGAAINAELMAKPGGFLENIRDFLHDHANTIKIFAEIAGGAWMIRAGRNQQNTRKQWSGMVIMTGWLASLLIKEKRFDPIAYQQVRPAAKDYNENSKQTAPVGRRFRTPP